MSDYRFQIVKHNGETCLHVMIDHAEIDENGEEIIHTYIPFDVLQTAIHDAAQVALVELSDYFKAAPQAVTLPQVIHEVESKQLALGKVDYYMQYLGGTLNLLDPDGTFKGMPSEETYKKGMEEVRRNYRDLSDAILALREKE